MYKYMPTLRNGKLTDRRTGTVSGTLYVPSVSDENNLFIFLNQKVKSFSNSNLKNNTSLISTQSTSSSSIKEKYDYIFIDPPFGSKS